MTFRRSDLQEAFFVPGTHPFRVWGYGTTDPLAEVLAPGYFALGSALLRPGELIYVSVAARQGNGAERAAAHLALVMVRADARSPDRGRWLGPSRPRLRPSGRFFWHASSTRTSGGRRPGERRSSAAVVARPAAAPGNPPRFQLEIPWNLHRRPDPGAHPPQPASSPDLAPRYRDGPGGRIRKPA